MGRAPHAARRLRGPRRPSIKPCNPASVGNIGGSWSSSTDPIHLAMTLITSLCTMSHSLSTGSPGDAYHLRLRSWRTTATTLRGEFCRRIVRKHDPKNGGSRGLQGKEMAFPSRQKGPVGSIRDLTPRVRLDWAGPGCSPGALTRRKRGRSVSALAGSRPPSGCRCHSAPETLGGAASSPPREGSRPATWAKPSAPPEGWADPHIHCRFQVEMTGPLGVSA